MRLLTHNFLQSNVRGTTEGYPLKINATNVIVEESTMDNVLIRKTLNKLNYPALVAAVSDIKRTASIQSNSSSIFSEAPNIPLEPPKEGGALEESTLRALHFFLFDVHVLEGILLCPDTGRKFPIKDGIPNMILHEDEV
jgi:multifunctional methyltransferase subunit TRM112